MVGANVHDAEMLAGTIADMIVGRPCSEDGVQHLCLDKGYCNPTGKAAAENEDYVAHIRQIGEESSMPAGVRRIRPGAGWSSVRALG